MNSLPQTNLQLYQLLRESDATDSAIASVRDAYDIAKQLFGNCFRPDDRPFVCHLVGTGAALAMWGQPTEIINAGLLHSAYLFGNFSDAERGATDRRRKWLQDAVGKQTEDLIWRYTSFNFQDQSFASLYQQTLMNASRQDVLILKTADTYDEAADGSFRYSTKASPIAQYLNNPTEEASFLRSVTDLIGEDAASDFHLALRKARDLEVPASMISQRKSFYEIRPGIDALRRGFTKKKFTKIAYKLRRPFRNAA